jgi:oxalate decarboxylase/phosphoglucose isomerase-like protein (cupin superfamily)
MSKSIEKFVFDKNDPNAPKIFTEGAQGPLKIPSKHILTPHWHPNATEVTTCSGGKGTVAIIYPDPESPHDPGRAIHKAYEFDENKIVKLPQGYFHYFVNTGTDDFIINLTFNNKDFDILSLNEMVSLLPSNIKITSIISNPTNPIIRYQFTEGEKKISSKLY